MKTNEDNLRKHWNNVKCTTIHIIRVPEREERERKGQKKYSEIIAQNFPNMGKEALTQIQEAQQVTHKINTRRNTLRHRLNEQTKIKYKEKILKAAREKKQITYKGTLIRLSADFSAEALKARKVWQDILKEMKGKKPPTKITLPSKALIQI